MVRIYHIPLRYIYIYIDQYSTRDIYSTMLCVLFVIYSLGLSPEYAIYTSLMDILSSFEYYSSADLL